MPSTGCRRRSASSSASRVAEAKAPSPPSRRFTISSACFSPSSASSTVRTANCRCRHRRSTRLRVPCGSRSKSAARCVCSPRAFATAKVFTPTSANGPSVTGTNKCGLMVNFSSRISHCGWIVFANTTSRLWLGRSSRHATRHLKRSSPKRLGMVKARCLPWTSPAARRCTQRVMPVASVGGRSRHSIQRISAITPRAAGVPHAAGLARRLTCRRWIAARRRRLSRRPGLSGLRINARFVPTAMARD